MYRLGVHLLGSPHIERGNQPIKVSRRKALALFAYLVVTGESQPRDRLVDLLWPEYNQRRGRTNLRRTLYALQQSLNGDWLHVDREEIGLNPDAEIWLDVDQFQERLAECRTHGHPTSISCSDCIAPLTAAVGLYHGDFLSGFGIKDSPNFDEWQLMMAEDLRRKFAQALTRLVDAYCDQGVFDLAINYARRWSAIDPLDEDAHCQLMQLYERSGQHTAALQQYQVCTQILLDELGIPPQPSTTAIYESIIKDQGRMSAAPGLDALGPWLSGPSVTPSIQDIDLKENTSHIFVARQVELAKLNDYLDKILNGQGMPVFVTGNAGQGKTVLMQEFAYRAQERVPELLVASGKCNAQTGIGDPYLPFREILGVLTGDVHALWSAGAISQEHARRLWDVFPEVLKTLVEKSPDLIETLISGSSLTRRAAAYFTGGMTDQMTWLHQLEKIVRIKAETPHEPYFQQAALLEQYTQLMGILAQERPMLLILDDLQWADLSSISLLFHLGRHLGGRNILILGAFRPHDVRIGRAEERHPLESVVNEFHRTYGDVDISLAKTENRRFLEEFIDSEPNLLGKQFRDTLYRQTKGHPLFTIELLRGMQERKDLIRNKKGYWVQKKRINWEILPTRIEAVIAERIGRLENSLQDVLRIASVEGEIFTAEVLAKVLSANPRDIVASLSNKLERVHRLVRAQEIQRLGARRLSRYRFRHILFQNFLYQSLDPVEKAYLHESVGEALEDLYGQETQEIALSLAHHFEEAGIEEKAITYLFQAGDRAKKRSANEAAITHLRRGLYLLKKLPHTPERDRMALKFYIALGVSLVLTRGHADHEVEAAYLEAQELCAHVGDDSQYFQVLLGLRRFYLFRLDLENAQKTGEQLIALAERMQNPAFLSRAYMMRAETLLQLGEFAQALEASRFGLSVNDSQQSRSEIYLFGNDNGVGCRIFEALALWYLGYPDQSQRRIEQALRLANKLSHPFTLVFCLFFSANIFYLCRDIEKVDFFIQPLLKISQVRGFALYQAWGEIFQGWAVALQGATESGIKQMQNGLSALQSREAKTMSPNFKLLQVEAYREAAQIDKGLLLLAEALATVKETGARIYEAELYRLQGELLLMNGHAKAEVETYFLRALEIARKQKARGWELRAALSLYRLEQHNRQASKAYQTLQEIYAWYREGFDTPDLLEAEKLLSLNKEASAS